MTEVVKRDPERFKRFAPDTRTVIPPDAPPPEPGVWTRENGRAVFVRITIPEGYDTRPSHT